MIVKHLTFLLTFFAFLTTGSAQNGLNLAIKTGSMGSFEKIAFNGSQLDIKRGQESSGAMAISMSLPVKGKFRLGAEFGMQSLGLSMDYKQVLFGNRVTWYRGSYRVVNLYTALIPEYRPVEWFYIQAGMGYFPEIYSQYTNGLSFETIDGVSVSTDLVGLELYRYNTAGYLAGFGLCPRVNKSLCLQLEVRYMSLPAGKSGEQRTTLGYNSLRLTVGLLYNPKS
jgi:hypothetical protein